MAKILVKVDERNTEFFIADDFEVVPKTGTLIIAKESSGGAWKTVGEFQTWRYVRYVEE